MPAKWGRIRDGKCTIELRQLNLLPFVWLSAATSWSELWQWRGKNVLEAKAIELKCGRCKQGKRKRFAVKEEEVQKETQNKREMSEKRKLKSTTDTCSSFAHFTRLAYCCCCCCCCKQWNQFGTLNDKWGQTNARTETQTQLRTNESAKRVNKKTQKK